VLADSLSAPLGIQEPTDDQPANDLASSEPSAPSRRRSNPSYEPLNIASAHSQDTRVPGPTNPIDSADETGSTTSDTI
jgi:hypothetical protein